MSISIAEDLLALAERWEQELRSYRAHSATRRLPRFLIGHPVLSVQQAAAGLRISVPAANAALNNLLASGIVSLVSERQWGRVFQATPVLQRLDQLPAPRHAQDTAQTAAPAGAAVAAPTAAPVVPLTTSPASAKRLVLNMTGPTFVTQAKDWPAFQEEWRATFADHAKEAGVAFDVQKGEARPTGETGTLLRVYVNDYRLVGIGSRVFFGVMTGNAYIDAKATYTDLNDGKEFGERAYNTTSSAWAGVFAKMTPQQVDQIATKVFGELRTATSQ